MKEIPGYPGYYATEDGQIWSEKRHRFLKPSKKTNEHLAVVLCVSGVRRDFYVHRLILLAFVGPCPRDCSLCRHLNDDPEDNRPENLRWGTPQENADDASRHGLLHGCNLRGEAAGRHRFTEDQVKAMRDAYASGTTQLELGRQYGARGATISGIVRRRTWTK